MRVRNPNMAGCAMGLRFTKKRVEFDDKGEADIPDKDAKFLCATPGWTEVGAKAPRKPAEPKAEPAPPLATPTLPERRDEPTVLVKLAETTKTEPPPAAEEEGPDLTNMSRAKLDKVIEAYELELPAELKRAKVDVVRAWVESQLYEEA